MAAFFSSESGRRFMRHLHEILVVVAIAVLLQATGFVAVDLPVWAFPTALLVATAAISAVFSQWGENASQREIHYRASIQLAILVTLIYLTGWGPALVPVLLFSVADNVKYSGCHATRPVVGWALGFTAVAQAGVALDLVPTALDHGASHGVALLGALVVAFVSHRIAKMTDAKERAEGELRRSETRFRTLIEQASDVVLVISDTHITFQSPSAAQVLGYDEDSLLGCSYLDLLHPDDQGEVVTAVQELMKTPNTTGILRQRVRHADGSWVLTESNVRNLLHDPDVEGFVVNLRDITERQELEAELEHRAFHDPLTGLANRMLFQDRLEHLVARAHRKEQRFAVLYVDLDGFKAVNDTQGHTVGDSVLWSVAEILRGCIRDSDTAARLGGDEFALVLEDLRDTSDAARVAGRVIDKIGQPMTVDGQDVLVTASVGIALFERGDTADTVLRNADIAMYMAKNAGKGRYEIFEPSMHLQVVERLALESDLQQALDRDELVLHYQPIVRLEDGGIEGVEALIRWQHPERGLVSPGEFIPVAEDTGLIIPIGAWVLQEACKQIVAWQEAFPTRPPLHVAVNVSMKQLSYGDIVSDVAETLEVSGIDPSCLTLELTESALVGDPESTIAILHELKSLGVRLAVDDFGTGYSSLSYLQRFPVDVLKIDRSFVEGLVSGSQSPALVRAIVEMGHSLRLQTVAEGIEHHEELSQFRRLQCQLGQGYLFARPGDGTAIETLLHGLASTDGSAMRLPAPLPDHQ